MAYVSLSTQSALLPGETCEEAVARLTWRNSVLAGRGDINTLESRLIAAHKQISELEHELYEARMAQAEYPTLAAWLKKRLGL